MQHFRTVSIVILSYLILTNCTAPNSDKVVGKGGTFSYIKAKGSQLVDDSGNILFLKGTNIGNWLVPEGYMFKMEQVNAPRKIDELLYELVGPDSLARFWNDYLDNYITHEDIKYLKRIGCNHIRLPFHYQLFTDDLYMGKRNVGFTYFDRIIEWCKAENLYVLLDMHCAPGGQTGDNIDDSYGYPYLFKSKSSQDEMSRIWMQIAKRYKAEPIILGYDLINEPIAHYFNDELDDLNPRLFNLYKRLVKEIRAIDSNHLIFLNGSVWAGNFDVFESIIDDNIVYEFHKYWFDVNQEAIQTYLDFRERHNVPVYIGETGENSDEWVADFRILLDNNEVGWCFWPYKKMNNKAGIMNFDEPDAYKVITAYAKRDRASYAAMRENRPDGSQVQQALNAFLINCQFKNCYPNVGYVKALGFQVE